MSFEPAIVKIKDVLLIWEAPLLSCKNTSCCTPHTTDGVHMGICTCLHVLYFIINCRNYVHIMLALSCYGHQQTLLYHLSSSDSLSLDVPLSGNNYVRLQPLTAVSIQFIPVYCIMHCTCTRDGAFSVCKCHIHK